MRRLLLYLAGICIGTTLAAGAWVLLLVGQIGAPTTGSAWVSELILAKESAVRGAPGNALILTGGSDVLFGLSATEAQAALDRPVVNFGLHEELGLRYMLHRVRAVARPGDTICLMLDYDRLGGEPRFPPLLSDFLLNADPRWIGTAPWREALRFVLGVPLKRIVQGYRAALGLPQGANWPLSRGIVTTTGDVRRSVAAVEAERRLSAAAPLSPVLDAQVKADLAALAAWGRENRVEIIAVWEIGPFQSAYREPAFEALVRDTARYLRRIDIAVKGGPLDLLRPTDSGRIDVSEDERSRRTALLATALEAGDDLGGDADAVRTEPSRQ